MLLKFLSAHAAALHCNADATLLVGMLKTITATVWQSYPVLAIVMSRLRLLRVLGGILELQLLVRSFILCLPVCRRTHK